MGILGKRYGGKNRDAGVQRFKARNSESALKKKRKKRKSAHASKRRNKK